jgi:hypothetical protein
VLGPESRGRTGSLTACLTEAQTGLAPIAYAMQ